MTILAPPREHRRHLVRSRRGPVARQLPSQPRAGAGLPARNLVI